MDSLAILEDIETKIKKLKSRNERLLKENEELRKSVFDYLQKLETQKNEILHTKSILNAGQVGQKSDLDAKQLKKDLDKYISMIDKCIASINVHI